MAADVVAAADAALVLGRALLVRVERALVVRVLRARVEREAALVLVVAGSAADASVAAVAVAATGTAAGAASSAAVCSASPSSSRLSSSKCCATLLKDCWAILSPAAARETVFAFDAVMLSFAVVKDERPRSSCCGAWALQTTVRALVWVEPVAVPLVVVAVRCLL